MHELIISHQFPQSQSPYSGEYFILVDDETFNSK